MKKIILCTTIFLLSCSIVAVLAEEDVFINHLRNCSPYSSSGDLKAGGANATSSKNILGWQNDKCRYQENINIMGIDSKVSCSFTKAQVAELVKVTDAYGVVSQYSDKKEDLSDLETIQQNPVAKVWTKYLNDPSVCTLNIDMPNN